MATLTVPSRFNGPLASGQGGYSCAALAAHLDGTAAVSLRRPVPLAEPLEVRLERGDADHGGDGAVGADGGTAARAFGAGGELVAEALAAASLTPWEAPPVTLEAARRAKSRFVPFAGGTFDRCFVCGLERADGFHIHPGPVEGTDLVASPWTPPAWAAGADGNILAEFVWAALDCPGYFAIHGADLALAYLARQQSEVLAPVRAGGEYVVVGRPLAREGRKGFASTAILDPDGTVLALSEQLLVAPRQAVSHK